MNTPIIKTARNYFFLTVYLFIIPFSRITISYACSETGTKGIGSQELTFKIHKRKNESAASDDYVNENSTAQSPLEDNVEIKQNNFVLNFFAKQISFLKKAGAQLTNSFIHISYPPFYIRFRSLSV